MTIKIGEIQANDNYLGGVQIEGKVDLDIDKITALRNGGEGVVVRDTPCILEALGLPKDTNPKDLANLILQVQNESEQNRERIIKNSSLFSKILPNSISTTALISNVLNIANHPQFQAIVDQLKQ